MAQITQFKEIDPEDPLLSVQETADILKKDKRWVWRNRRSSTPIPFIKVDRTTTLYRRSQVLAWLAKLEISA